MIPPTIDTIDSNAVLRTNRLYILRIIGVGQVDGQAETQL